MSIFFSVLCVFGYYGPNNGLKSAIIVLKWAQGSIRGGCYKKELSQYRCKFSKVCHTIQNDEKAPFYVVEINFWGSYPLIY